MADSNSVEPKKKKKEKMSVKQIVTTVIIAVLALLMIGGLSYIIAGIQQKKSEDAYVFGTYDGTDIKLAYGNVFYNTLANDEDLAESSDFSTIYTSYQEGYRNQVMFVAIDKMAKKANIKYTQNVIDDYLIDSGIFDDDEGNFSLEVYESYGDAYLQQADSYAKTIYPYTVVIDDYESLLTSPLETAFVAEMFGTGREFDYMIVDFTNYPDDLAAEYGAAHAEEFIQMDVSMITVESEDDAKAVVAALDGGMTWADAVAQYSLDSYAEDEGHIGIVNPWNIKNNLTNTSDIDTILALEKGQYSQPIQGLYSWTVYRMEEDVIFEPDFTNYQTLVLVKYYISNNDSETISSYLATVADEAYAAAVEDFDAASDKYSAYGTITIGPVANNVGESTMLYGFEDYDYVGYFAEAVGTEESLYTTLYTSEAGTVVGPYAYDGGYVIIRVGEDSSNELGLVSLLSAYAESVPTFLVNDLATSITSSEKFEDNFFTVLFNMLMSSYSSEE